MSEQRNKEVVRSFVEAVLNGGEDDRMSEFFGPDAVDHFAFGSQASGIEEMKDAVVSLRGAFPDATFAIEDLIAEGDKVVTRSIFTGTHRGNFLGMAATGNAVSFSVITVTRMADGKQTERWGMYDQMAMMQQLGAIPAEGPPSAPNPPDAFPS